MAHAIPKIEWKHDTETATRASGSPTLTTIADTTYIEAGMLVEGTGIPTGTTVLSKTVSTVVMSANATSNGTASVNFLYRLSFEYPPIESGSETIDPKERQSVSISGKVQTSIDFLEGKRDLVFAFLSQTLFEQLKNFHSTHAYIGREFRYFDDKTLNSYLTYELADLKFTGKKIASRGYNYVWTVPLKFRRVI